MGVRKEVTVSISYFDFKFKSLGDASMFAFLAASSIVDQDRPIELNVKYISTPDTEENDDNSDNDEEE